MAFVRVPGNIEPEGAEELWLGGRGGVRLRAIMAPAQGPPRGSVILCNGRTEFLEKYFEVIRELQERGFVVFSMDWRGQGLSDRLTATPHRGHIDGFDDAASDLQDAVRAMGDRLPRPHLVLAHSMGGAIALRALQTRRLEVDAAVFSAPMWGLANVGEQGLKFARFMAAVGAGKMFAPGVETRWRKENFKRNKVTHDKERFVRAQALIQAEPRLALAGPTLGWVAAAAGAIEGFKRPSALAHLRFPVLVLSAGKDALIDNEEQEEVARLLPNATFEPIEGARHELMMETDDVRQEFWRRFDAFAEKVAPARGGVATV